MTKLVRAAGLAAAVVGASYAPFAALTAAAPPPQAQRKVPDTGASPPSRTMLDQYCVRCHNDKLKSGSLSLAQVDVSRPDVHAQVLEKVARKLRGGTMPPEGQPRPDGAALEQFVSSLEASLDDAAAAAPNPGRVASRRLNRAEYVNTIYDLLALEVNGSELLPGDMAGFGFDNNADVLAITPGLMARYMSAATKISRAAVGSPETRPIMQVYKVGFENQEVRMGEDMPFATKGGLAVRHTFPLDGEYVFQIRLKKNGTVSTINGIEEDEHDIEVRVDHALMKRFKIGGRFKGPDPGVLIAVSEDDVEGQKIHDYRLNADKELELRIPVKAGTRLVSAGFTVSAPTPMQGGARGRLGAIGNSGPGVDMLYISGPFHGRAPQDTPSRQRIFSCQPTTTKDEEACARKILGSLARRAYRRPVTDADITPLLDIYREGRTGQNFDAGIERALEAMLSSPKFLMRVEREPAGAKPQSPYRLTDLELATRLSFFLWRSIPDDELLDLAVRGQLKEPKVLDQQVRRMVADRRASRFMKDFVEQWLEVRNLQEKDPDAALFPGFDDSLRKAMARETELFFESQVREDQPLQELMRSNQTFLNEQLARHYGIEDIYGSHFRRVTLTDERRFGLLGKSSVLLVTSYANRTSVVLRGKWVLENLLGAPPPPPPPNVPPLKENDGKSKPTALRERMEAHRNNPVCASCHSRMDPLGFALEHYDAIGKWRENDSGASINSTITLNGKTIESAKGFREALLTNTDEFVHTVVEKLLTYALGRGLDYYDGATVRQLARDLARDQYRWSSLISGIVRSTPFQMRTAMPAAPATTSAAAQQ